MKRRCRALAAFAVFFLAFNTAYAQESEPAPDRARTLIVASGEIGGFHYPVAGALCRIVNAGRAEHGLRCVVEPTSGSGSNLAMLRAGEVDLALVQSKAQFDAYRGLGVFAEIGGDEAMRSLISLHSEAVVVVARKGAKVASLADLKGKRVNLGPPGSFQRVMADTALRAAGLDGVDFPGFQEMESGRQAQALCAGEIDAAFFVGVHPLPSLAAAVKECGAFPMAIDGDGIAAFLEDHPFLTAVTLGRETYPSLKQSFGSIATRATLVASTRLGAQDAEIIVRAVMDRLDVFTTMHPALAGLSRIDMLRQGLTAPRHDGVQDFLR